MRTIHVHTRYKLVHLRLFRSIVLVYAYTYLRCTLPFTCMYINVPDVHVHLQVHFDIYLFIPLHYTLSSDSFENLSSQLLQHPLSSA